jgi:DNA-binding NarL/FixJ family response regulator
MQGVTALNRRNEEGIFTDAEMGRLVEELSLSPKQTALIRCLFAGCSDKQIAIRMQIHISTVRTHITRLFRKFDVDDREGLILYIFRHFLTEYRRVECHRK